MFFSRVYSLRSASGVRHGRSIRVGRLIIRSLKRAVRSIIHARSISAFSPITMRMFSGSPFVSIALSLVLCESVAALLDLSAGTVSIRFRVLGSRVKSRSGTISRAGTGGYEAPAATVRKYLSRGKAKCTARRAKFFRLTNGFRRVEGNSPLRSFRDTITRARAFNPA